MSTVGRRVVDGVVRRRSVILVGLLIAGALVTPVQLLGRLASDTLQTDLAERNAAERVRGAQLGASLIYATLRNAGDQLAVLATRPSVQAAFTTKDRAALGRELSTLKDTGGYDIVQAVDADGLQLSRIPEAALGDQSSRGYFQGALRSTSWVASAGFVTQAPSPVVMAGVSYGVHVGGKNLGVLFVGVSPERILASLEPIRNTPRRELLVLDQQQVVIASTSPRHILLSVVDEPGLDRARTGSSGTVTVDGGRRIGTFSPLADLRWTLYLLDDPAVILAPERGLAQQIEFATGIATLLALLIAALIATLYARLAEANRRVLAATQREAITDSLTGLYNRRFLDEQLHLLHSLATRGHRPYSVLLFDVDGLKTVNDTSGHECGDRVLQLVADGLRDSLRASDVPIRFGGDEFVALLPETGVDMAAEVAERVRVAVRQRTRQDPRLAVDISAGVAGWCEGADEREVLKAADEGLYAAKRGGKGRIARYPIASHA